MLHTSKAINRERINLSDRLPFLYLRPQEMEISKGANALGPQG